MPLSNPPTLKMSPPTLSSVRGRKALSLLEILEQTTSGYNRTKDKNFDAPIDMSDEQMLAYYKLCLFNYMYLSRNNFPDITKRVHPSFIMKTALRTEIARYTSALLEGMVRLFIFKFPLLHLLIRLKFYLDYHERTGRGQVDLLL